MALNILQLHAKVYLDLLAADVGPPPLVVFRGGVPLDPNTGKPTIGPPYVVVYFAFRTPSGVDEPDKVSLEATSDVLYTSAYCHSVGGDEHAALAVGGRVRGALRGVRPVISGRECGPIGWADGAPVQRDETTGTSVFDLVETWQFTSLPG